MTTTLKTKIEELAKTLQGDEAKSIKGIMEAKSDNWAISALAKSDVKGAKELAVWYTTRRSLENMGIVESLKKMKKTKLYESNYDFSYNALAGVEQELNVRPEYQLAQTYLDLLNKYSFDEIVKVEGDKFKKAMGAFASHKLVAEAIDMMRAMDELLYSDYIAKLEMAFNLPASHVKDFVIGAFGRRLDPDPIICNLMDSLRLIDNRTQCKVQSYMSSDGRVQITKDIIPSVQVADSGEYMKLGEGYFLVTDKKVTEVDESEVPKKLLEVCRVYEMFDRSGGDLTILGGKKICRFEKGEKGLELFINESKTEKNKESVRKALREEFGAEEAGECIMQIIQHEQMLVQPQNVVTICLQDGTTITIVMCGEPCVITSGEAQGIAVCQPLDKEYMDGFSQEYGVDLQGVIKDMVSESIFEAGEDLLAGIGSDAADMTANATDLGGEKEEKEDPEKKKEKEELEQEVREVQNNIEKIDMLDQSYKDDQDIKDLYAKLVGQKTIIEKRLEELAQEGEPKAVEKEILDKDIVNEGNTSLEQLKPKMQEYATSIMRNYMNEEEGGNDALIKEAEAAIMSAAEVPAEDKMAMVEALKAYAANPQDKSLYSTVMSMFEPGGKVPAQKDINEEESDDVMSDYMELTQGGMDETEAISAVAQNRGLSEEQVKAIVEKGKEQPAAVPEAPAIAEGNGEFAKTYKFTPEQWKEALTKMADDQNWNTKRSASGGWEVYYGDKKKFEYDVEKGEVYSNDEEADLLATNENAKEEETYRVMNNSLNEASDEAGKIWDAMTPDERHEVMKNSDDTDKYTDLSDAIDLDWSLFDQSDKDMMTKALKKAGKLN